MDEKQEWRIGGYVFFTEKDAQLAKAEEKRIKYLEDRIDYSKPENILYVYEKSIHERIFRTPVGLEYLRAMRSFLLEQESIDAEGVSPVPFYGTIGEIADKQAPLENVDAKPLQQKQDKQEKRKAGYTISVILNVLLALAICAMFGISLNSDNPNVLNYEKSLKNKYASWEQELTQREQAVREKEKELLFTE